MDLFELSARLRRHLRPGVPKYVSLRDAFIEAIAAGALRSGDKMPNEQELAATLPMSLGTIQRALRELVTSGVIDRRPGQGSFIKAVPGRGEMAHPFHCRFIGDDGQSYLPVYPEVLSRNRQVPAGPWHAVLSSNNVVEITRRIRVADEFHVHTAFYIDVNRVPVFRDLSLDELADSNFKDVIFKTCGQAVTTIDLMMKQERPPAALCDTLGVPAGTMCTGIRAIGHFPNADAVYYQHIHIPPTDRELHVVADARAPGFLGTS